jgi:hypothetical protein
LGESGENLSGSLGRKWEDNNIYVRKIDDDDDDDDGRQVGLVQNCVQWLALVC